MSPSSALITALSGFWFQYFRDLGDIEAMYEGAEEYAGNLYAELLHTVLGTSVRDVPLNRQENYVLWQVRDADVVRQNGVWGIRKAKPWHHIRYIQDRLLNPTIILDEPSNYTVDREVVSFGSTDPRTLFKAAAVRQERPQVGGLIQTDAASNVGAGDVLVLENLSNKRVKVMYANAYEIGLVLGSSIELESAEITWRIEGQAAQYIGRLYGPTEASENGVVPRRGNMNVYGVWAVEGRVDDLTLYNNFGYQFDSSWYDVPAPVPSDARYRNFLLGIMRLYSLGPTLRRLEEGLTAAAGLPLVSSDGEVVLSVDGAAGVVVTSAQEYRLPPSVPLRSDLAPGKVLRGFEVLTDAVHVVDYLTDPCWWHGITLPQHFLPTHTLSQRMVVPELFETRIGVGYRNTVGNPGVLVGDTWHRTAAYTATDAIFKYSLFAVRLHPALDNPPGTLDRLENIVQELRPSDRYGYVGVLHKFADTHTPDDALVFNAARSLSDRLNAASDWQIGTGIVGQTVAGTGATGAGIGSSTWPVIIGGGYPGLANETDAAAATDNAVFIQPKAP